MPNVIILKTLNDVVRYINDPENHPAFRVFWGEAGVEGRVNYVLSNPDSPLRLSVENDVKRMLKEAYTEEYKAWAIELWERLNA